MHSLQRELHQSTPFQSAAQEATISILRTADVVRRKLASAIEPRGITFQQYNVLRILRGTRAKPLTASEIGDRLIEQTPGVTRLLDRLERKEYIRRERSGEDRRVVNTWITEAGLVLLRELDAAVDQADESAVDGLAGEQLEQLVRLLEQVRTQ